MKINDDENERSISNERSMKVHKKSVRAIGLTPDGQSIITVSKDKSIKFRSTETGQMIHKYNRAHEYFNLFVCFFFFFIKSFFSSPINCLCVVDNCVLATGDDDGYVKVNN
jgi:WD40 repeat protein